MSFAELGLSTPLLRAVSERHYLTPTPVQALAIPAVLQGRDVWACAQTGSGKTAAFALPLLQALAAHPPQTPRPVRVLILVPTRELAAQIAEAIQRYAAHLPTAVKVVTALGGVSINPQMMALRGGAEPGGADFQAPVCRHDVHVTRRSDCLAACLRDDGKRQRGAGCLLIKGGLHPGLHLRGIGYLRRDPAPQFRVEADASQSGNMRQGKRFEPHNAALKRHGFYFHEFGSGTLNRV